jgi:phosphoglycolate phosphatase
MRIRVGVIPALELNVCNKAGRITRPADQIGEKMHYKAVVFDMDGTLLNTLEDLGDAMNRVLQARNFPTHSIDRYRFFVGKGAANLVTCALPEDRRDKAFLAECLNDFLREYKAGESAKTKLYEGIPELLDLLEERGLLMAVLTNKPQAFAEECMRLFLPHWSFAMTLGQIPGMPVKPDPAGPRKLMAELDLKPEEILYLGDTDVDMHTAVNAGMYPIGVLCGFRSEEELRKSGAKSIISHPLDLQSFLE